MLCAVSPTLALMYFINIRGTHGNKMDKFAIECKTYYLTKKSLIILNSCVEYQFLYNVDLILDHSFMHKIEKDNLILFFNCWSVT